MAPPPDRVRPPARAAGPGKHDNWRSAAVAGAYDARRFGGLAGRLKQARDEALVRGILDARPTLRSVLDLPAGTGRLLPALAAGGRRVVAADRALEMLAVGVTSSEGTVPRVQADVRALPFPDAAFDAVVCYRFLFHLAGREERVAALAELARVARQLVVVQVRSRGNAKQAGRWLRARVAASAKWRPAPSRADTTAELHAAGLVAERFLPVSRLSSDKALVVAVPRGG